MEIPRLANPATNPNGYMAAIGAVVAAVVMLTNAVSHHGVIDTTVIVSGVGAFLALVSRQYVTPVSDPRDGNGNSLLPPAPPLAGMGGGGGGGTGPVTPGPVVVPSPAPLAGP